MAPGIDVTGLEGKKAREEGMALVPRDFFWDSIALFVISAIIGLTVLDAVTEFIRGGSVECFLPQGVSLGEVSKEYVNTFCSGNVPFTQYFPVYIIITGALIAVPHYLWLNHYRGNFEFFFYEVGKLERQTDVETDQHFQNNAQIVKRLTVAFATYKQSTIYLTYILKLAAQWIVTAASIVIAFLFFRSNNFMKGFRCPVNNNTDAFWPFEPERAFCIYNTLVLISYLRIAYLCLICVLLLSLSWALFWCFCTHATELGHKDVASFTYLTGLPSKYYVANLPIPAWSCCRFLRRCLLKCVSSIPWFTWRSGPKIRSDLDFLVMQLFRTDSGLAYTFKDVQVKLALKDLLDDDQRRLYIHCIKHLDSDDAMPELAEWKQGASEKYLKWRFTKRAKEGIYSEFSPVPRESELVVPDTLLGAVLGYAACAPIPMSPNEFETEENEIYCSYPRIMNAISISFDSVGYGTSLARAFNWVGSVTFSTTIDPNADSPVKCTSFSSNMTSVVLKADILSSDVQTQSEIYEPLRNLWLPTPDADAMYETSFIVLGPVPKDNPGHITTVELFLDSICECLGKNALLLTLTPETINDKSVKDQFTEYIPRTSRFRRHGLRVELSSRTLEWPARKSVQQLQRFSSESVPTSAEAAMTQRSTSEPNVSTALLEMGPSDGEYTHEYTHSLKCGKTRMTMKFATYQYAGFHYRLRGEIWKPRKLEDDDENVPENDVPDPWRAQQEEIEAQIKHLAGEALSNIADGLRQRKTETD